MLAVLAVIGLLLTRDALAIDGNYSSPYASQFDTRSAAAQLPNETLLGLFLLTLNAGAAAYFLLRDARRRRQAS